MGLVASNIIGSKRHPLNGLTWRVKLCIFREKVVATFRTPSVRKVVTGFLKERNMPSADVIVTNARIFTSNTSNPWAQAVAVKGSRIVYVGSKEGAESFKGPATRLI